MARVKYFPGFPIAACICLQILLLVPVVCTPAGQWRGRSIPEEGWQRPKKQWLQSYRAHSQGMIYHDVHGFPNYPPQVPTLLALISLSSPN